MSLRKVSTGEAFAPRASTWNAFIDAAIYAKRQQGQIQPVYAGREYPATTVLVRNDSGSDKDVLCVLGIDEPVITPTANLEEFKIRSGWSGVTPTADHFGRFVITAESIPDGEFGLAYTGGVCPVLLTVDEETFNRADIDAGTSVKLQASYHGSAQIIWKQSGTGASKWGVIQFDTPREVSHLGKTNSEITVDNSGGVSVWIDGSDTGYDLDECWLDWMHGGQNISSGKEVIVKYFPMDAKWRIIHAECE